MFAGSEEQAARCSHEAADTEPLLLPRWPVCFHPAVLLLGCRQMQNGLVLVS